MLKDILGKLKYNLSQPIQNKHLRFGVPFLLFMTFGLIIIRQCATVRYDFRKNKTLDREELERLGISKPQFRPIEEIYEEYKQNIDVDNWENVRIPRFWEEEESSAAK